MIKRKVIAGMTAALLFGGMIPTVQASADADIFASIEAVSNANPNYNVTATKTEFTGWNIAMIGNGIFRIRGGESTDSGYGESVTFLNADGMILKEMLYLDEYDPEKEEYTYFDRDFHLDSGIISIYARWDSADYPSHGEYYDLNGNVLFSHPDYVTNSEMINGIALVRYYVEGELKAYLINDRGETVLELPEIFTEWDSEYWRYKADIAWYSDGVINFSTTGDIFGNTIFDIVDYTEGEATCGYFDLEGNVVLPQTYTNVYPFFDGLAAVETFDEGIGYMYSYINKNGETVIAPGKYTAINNFYFKGYACVGREGYYGYIQKSGEEVIPLEYTDIGGFDFGDYLYARKDEYYGYIDEHNNIIIPFEYDSAYGETEELFTVGNSDWQYGMVDKNNNTVIPLLFDDISVVHNGVAYAILNEEVYRLEITPEAGASSGELEDGDLDGDQKINSADAALILKSCAELGIGNPSGLTPAQEAAADVDKNGTINAVDAAYILKYAARVGAGESDLTIAEVVNA